MISMISFSLAEEHCQIGAGFIREMIPAEVSCDGFGSDLTTDCEILA